MFRTLRELNRLKPLTKKTNYPKIVSFDYYGSIIFGVGDSHTSFIWNKK